MNDELEDFVKTNRAAFDDKEPSTRMWETVAASLPRRRLSLWNNTAVWRVAAMLSMVLSGYLLWPKAVAVKQGEVAMKEFTEAEAFYVSQISQRVEMIHEFPREDGLNGFTHDFHQLEAMYSVLREEMKTRPSNKVKDALVLNLLVRIDLLNQQLHKLEQEHNGDKNESDEGLSS